MAHEEDMTPIQQLEAAAAQEPPNIVAARLALNMLAEGIVPKMDEQHVVDLGRASELADGIAARGDTDNEVRQEFTTTAIAFGALHRVFADRERPAAGSDQMAGKDLGQGKS